MPLIEELIPWSIQPQFPVGVDRSNPFVQRGILFAFNAATGTDAVKGVLGTPVGALSKNPGPSGVLEKYSTDNVNRSFARSDAGWLGSQTIIAKFRSGSTGTRLFSKSVADGTDNPLRVSLEPTQNGIYVVRAGAASAYRSYKPVSAITTQSIHKAIAIVFDGATSFTTPTFYDGKTAVAGTVAYTGSDAAITGTNAPAVVGNWGTGGVMEVEWCYVFPYAMTAAEVASVMDNPNQIFQPQSRSIYVASAGGVAALTGTITTANEGDIVTGGKTIILTLTGDTWIAAGAASFDLQRQNIINGLTSAQSETFGWNLVVKALQGVAGVVRTSDTVVTITLDARATYDITATETITATIPATALTLAGAVVAAPTFTVTATTAGGWLNRGYWWSQTYGNLAR